MSAIQIGDHRNLVVWQKAMRLAAEVYRATVAFLHIARGSQAELDTQLRLAREFGYLPESDFLRLIADTEEIGRLLTAVIAGLRRRQAG